MFPSSSSQLEFLNLIQEPTSMTTNNCDNNSYLNECSDPKMIKLQFNSKCSSNPQCKFRN